MRHVHVYCHIIIIYMILYAVFVYAFAQARRQHTRLFLNSIYIYIVYRALVYSNLSLTQQTHTLAAQRTQV